MDFIKYNISRIIPTIVAIIFGITTVRLTIRGSKKKKLGYYEVYKNKILDLSSSKFHKSIKIKYDNQEIQKLGYAICEFKNMGDEPILQEDFLDGGGICLSIKGSNIIGFKIQSNGKVDADEFLNDILIEPFNLNVSESIIFEIYSDGEIEEMDIGNPRIKGIRSITKYNNKNDKLFLAFLAFSIIFMGLVTYLNKVNMGDTPKSFIDNFADTKYMFLSLSSYIFITITYVILLKKSILRDKHNPFKNKHSLIQKMRKIFKY